MTTYSRYTELSLNEELRYYSKSILESYRILDAGPLHEGLGDVAQAILRVIKTAIERVQAFIKAIKNKLFNKGREAEKKAKECESKIKILDREELYNMGPSIHGYKYNIKAINVPEVYERSIKTYFNNTSAYQEGNLMIDALKAIGDSNTTRDPNVFATIVNGILRPGGKQTMVVDRERYKDAVEYLQNVSKYIYQASLEYDFVLKALNEAQKMVQMELCEGDINIRPDLVQMFKEGAFVIESLSNEKIIALKEAIDLATATVDARVSYLESKKIIKEMQTVNFFDDIIS